MSSNVDSADLSRPEMQASSTGRLARLLSCGLLGRRLQPSDRLPPFSIRTPLLHAQYARPTFSTMPSLETPSPIPVRVLVLGGSYGGLAAALNLLDLCHGKSARFTPGQSNESPRVDVQIKIIDRRDGYYHLIGSPLALASKEASAKNWVRFADLPALSVPGISWAQGSVLNVDCDTKIATIIDAESNEEYEEKYDYLVAATGLSRAWPAVPQSLTRKDYLTETGAHIDAVASAKDGVVVIGGGAVGVEMAAELKLVNPSQTVTLIHSRERLLSSEPLPDDFKDRSLSVLRECGVKVIMNDRVMDTQPINGSNSQRLILKDGSHLVAGHVIWALSHQTPTTSYLPAATLDTTGAVKILPTLAFAPGILKSESHFAIGDLAAWSGIKRCGGAMHMGYTAGFNIHQLILKAAFGTTPKFSEIAEFPPMIALAIGNKAVSYSPDEGVSWGEDQLKMMFGQDLGWTICWNYLGLGKDGSGNVKVEA